MRRDRARRTGCGRSPLMTSPVPSLNCHIQTWLLDLVAQSGLSTIDESFHGVARTSLVYVF
jgi:hypothetical protein